MRFRHLVPFLLGLQPVLGGKITIKGGDPLQSATLVCSRYARRLSSINFSVQTDINHLSSSRTANRLLTAEFAVEGLAATNVVTAPVVNLLEDIECDDSNAILAKAICLSINAAASFSCIPKPNSKRTSGFNVTDDGPVDSELSSFFLPSLFPPQKRH